MADTTFVFRVSGPTAGFVAALSLDASISEMHGRESVITEHPVEKGADIADHIRPRPQTLAFECLVSNTPIGGEPDFDRARNAWHQLDQAWKDGAVFTILTSLQTYDSFAITHLSAPRDSRTGEALRFSITFREVRRVATQTIAIPKPAAAKHNPKAHQGKQPGEQASPKTAKALDAKVEDFGKSIFRKIVGN